jgi:hypothetical protein
MVFNIHVVKHSFEKLCMYSHFLIILLLSDNGLPEADI